LLRALRQNKIDTSQAIRAMKLDAVLAANPGLNGIGVRIGGFPAVTALKQWLLFVFAAFVDMLLGCAGKGSARSQSWAQGCGSRRISHTRALRQSNIRYYVT
jgi:hypothetical protein